MDKLEMLRAAAAVCVFLLAGMGAGDFRRRKAGKGLLMIGLSILLSYGLAVNMGLI